MRDHRELFEFEPLSHKHNSTKGWSMCATHKVMFPTVGEHFCSTEPQKGHGDVKKKYFGGK